MTPQSLSHAARVYAPQHLTRSPGAGRLWLSEGEYLFDRGRVRPGTWTLVRSSFQARPLGGGMTSPW